MVTRLALFAVAALSLIAPATLPAQPLRYLGRLPGEPGGWIELGDRAHTDVRVGEHIPGWGRVKEIRDDRIVIEQHRTNAEKDEMARRGALPYDVLEIHVLRDEGRVQPSQ